MSSARAPVRSVGTCGAIWRHLKAGKSPSGWSGAVCTPPGRCRLWNHGPSSPPVASSVLMPSSPPRRGLGDEGLELVDATGRRMFGEHLRPRPLGDRAAPVLGDVAQ